MKVLTYQTASGKERIGAKDLLHGVVTGILLFAVVWGIGARNWVRQERNTLLLILLILALFFVVGLVRPVS